MRNRKAGPEMSWKIEVSGESGVAKAAAAASQQDVLDQVSAALQGSTSQISITPEAVTLPESAAPPALSENFWRTLVRRINDGRCTPFLGAGVNYGILPLGGEIAEAWATEKKYPLLDRHDLARVAQYRALTDTDPMECKEDLSRLLNNVNQPPPKSIEDEDQPIRLLANLPVPVYVTTNYDNLMVQALSDAGKQPIRELCRWNQHPKVTAWQSVWKRTPGFLPSEKKPVVFHLHGINDIYESLVLTEDDYLDFLVSMSKQNFVVNMSNRNRQQDKQLLPPGIQDALSGSSILFVGYSLADWTFRVLFRGLINSTEKGLRRVSVAVQLPPASKSNPVNVQAYLSRYFSNMDVQCYWGTAQQFMLELKQKMAQYNN